MNYGLAADSFGPQEIEAAIGVLKSGMYTMGERVKKFERALADWMGVKEAIMVNSGSSANLLLVDSLLRRLDQNEIKLRPGDEVLVPTLSWPTTVWPIVQLGLTPVFVDIDPNTLAISLESAEKLITPKTKAMFLIHVLGQACSMKEYTEFCGKYGLTLIEDCCESFGAFDQEKHVGSFGLGGTLSHFYSHHLTTMEGGMIVTNDMKLADDLRSMRAHGWVRDRSDKQVIAQQNPDLDSRFLFVMPGYNVRPLEIEAAIGLVQLERMDELLKKREEIAKTAASIVATQTPWIKLIGAEHTQRTGGTRRSRKHSWMNLPFVLERNSPLSLKETKARLEKMGVETRPIIAGNLTKHPVCQNIKMRVAPTTAVSDYVLTNGFMIGCNPTVSSDSLNRLEEAFKSLRP